MNIFKDAASLRSVTKPLMALWSIGDIQTFGSLFWQDNKPILTLLFDVDEATAHGFDKADIPILKMTRPPEQVTIFGTLPDFGTITLDQCARYNVRLNDSARAGRATYELDFLPTTVWMGCARTDVDPQVHRISIADSRLAGFFGTPGLEIYRRHDPDVTEAFSTLEEPESIWAVHGPDQPAFKIGETGWTLSVHTTSTETSSATAGHVLRSSIGMALYSAEPTSILEASRLLSKLEEIISTTSIEPFTFQHERYEGVTGESVTLVWRLGENRSQFQPPMRHQILVDLGDPQTFKTICERWFSASSTVSLSRWLFVRALRETDDGLARFVEVSQAFEVLGRELGPQNPLMPKARVGEAIELIRGAIENEFPEDFVGRVVGLIQSSNKSSFRDVLQHMLGAVVARHSLGTEEEIASFCKIISDTRNAVIHMSDNDKGKLTEAFSRINKLSLQLCFWYAVCQADEMRVRIPNIREFLFNNRNARHGLPNEMLDHQ